MDFKERGIFIKSIHETTYDKEVLSSLHIDCAACSGLCCVALFFMKADGFPENKVSGKACSHLKKDFCCDIHQELSSKKMRGCLSYDCFGAGQKTTQSYSSNVDWQSYPQQKEAIFDTYTKMFQIHQMRWYLVEAQLLISAKSLSQEVNALLLDNIQISNMKPDEIIRFDLTIYQNKVNSLLRKVMEFVAIQHHFKVVPNRKMNQIGKNFKGMDLSGSDFSTTLLIGANFQNSNLYGVNFIGADIRGANFANADLSEAIFLTQGQLNSALGNLSTKLPPMLEYPNSW